MHLKRKKVIRQITEDLESFSSVSNKECFFLPQTVKGLAHNAKDKLDSLSKPFSMVFL